MKVTNRKEEIKISRLLGASKFYVKKPFLLEGIYYGFFGGVLGSTTSLLFFLNFKDSINTFFTPIEFVKFDPAFSLLVIFSSLSLGMFISLFASWISSNRFIKF